MKLMKIQFSSMLRKRLLMSFTGVFLTGITVGFFQIANLGADPFTCFTLGWANLFHTTYGGAYPFVTGGLLLLGYCFDRRRFGVATILNLFLIGPIADIVVKVFSGFVLFSTINGRVLLLIATLAILCVGSSLYFMADLGVSGYDAVSQIISQKTKWQFRLCRIGTDTLCVVFGLLCGVLFGEKVGFGTILTAFCMGPVIQLCNDKITGPMLYGKGYVPKK